MHSVQGPRHSVSKGATAVIYSIEAHELRDSMGAATAIGLRDRALVAVMTFTFARVSAVVNLKVEDYYPQKKRWWLRLREKNGSVNEMPCHQSSKRTWMPTSRRPESETTARAALPRRRRTHWPALPRPSLPHRCLVHGARRAVGARIETAIGCHTFRATEITDYLTNGGRIEVAQRMAGHANNKTTGLYDRREDDISLLEVERVGI